MTLFCSCHTFYIHRPPPRKNLISLKNVTMLHTTYIRVLVRFKVLINNQCRVMNRTTISVYQKSGKECQWDNLLTAEIIVEMLSRHKHHNWREEDEPWYENVKIYYCRITAVESGEADCLYINEISWQCVCVWHISEHILSNEDDKILEFSPTQTILKDNKHQQRNHRNFIFIMWVLSQANIS